MATFNETLQAYVNLEYEELLVIAQKALINVLPACKVVDEKNDGLLMATSIILSAIAADGVLTSKEKQFLADALGLSDEAIAGMISMFDSSMIELVDKFADNLPANVKADTLTLVIAVAACDEKISREETALIRKILD